MLIPNLSLPLLLFHDYDYFFRPFFARLDARVDDLEEDLRPLRLLLLPLVLVLVLALLELELELELEMELELELLEAPPSTHQTYPLVS